MSGEIFNAFTRSAGASLGSTTPVDTAHMAPLHAAIAEIPAGQTLTLSPMRAVDLARALVQLSPRLSASTLVFGVDQTNFLERGANIPLAEVCECLEITPLEVFGSGCVALDDDGLARLLSSMQTTRLRLVRVDGPIEALDAKAIMAACDRGDSALEAEFRAVASVVIVNDAEITVELREKSHAGMLVSENLRQYLAAMLGRACSAVSVPFHWQAERLLGATGTILVRPIETEIYEAAVDVGIATGTEASAGPATLSLIYDLPSDTWHDEP